MDTRVPIVERGFQLVWIKNEDGLDINYLNTLFTSSNCKVWIHINLGQSVMQWYHSEIDLINRFLLNLP